MKSVSTPYGLSSAQQEACALFNFKFAKAKLLLVFVFATSWATYSQPNPGGMPAGFSSQYVLSTADNGNNFNFAVGLTFTNDGKQLFVWEKDGRAFICKWDIAQSKYVKQATPVLDLSDEISNVHDYGLLGFTLDPDFANNGYIYLMYVVDRWSLGFTSVKDEAGATFGRVTQYKTITSGSNIVIDPASRKVLIGDAVDNGIPIMHLSHGTGALHFGSDGTLLCSTGDGASYNATDDGGGDGGSYPTDGKAKGIIKANEDVGAYRAQMLNSHNGKILRIDKNTGNGIVSNPFYDPTKPNSPKSRIWALGLRNPFRFNVKPNTGSMNPLDGDPGTLYISDVQWNNYEEMNICDKPGQNFGWPVYEGIFKIEGGDTYATRNISNLDEPNPLFGQSGCTQQYFYFRNMIRDATPTNNTTINNPCNASQPINAGTNNSPSRFVHVPPALEWKHGASQTRIPTFSGSTQTATNIGGSSGVSGSQFAGNCAIGGTFYSGTVYPPEYNGTYFLVDYGQQWIKNLSFVLDNKLTAVKSFATSPVIPFAMAQNPLDGLIYYISHSDPSGNTGRMRKIMFGGNMPPVAVIGISNNNGNNYGTAPLTLDLNSTGSMDPTPGGSITYEWDFGDGSPKSTSANPQYTFSGTAGVGKSYTVKLKITDNGGASTETTMLVSVNNSPPIVQITTPVNNSKYPVDQHTNYAGAATVQDDQVLNASNYEWQVTLKHNTHIHPGSPINQVAPALAVEGEGCNSETYFYEVSLTVTDPLGLKTTSVVNVLPNCSSLPVTLLSFKGVVENWMHKLTWKTENESFISKYEIQRSNDGIHFQKIGELGPKDGNGLKDYIFYDQIPLAGNNYYRLRITHPDGTDEYSMIINLAKTGTGSSTFNVYPSPFNNDLVIQAQFSKAGDATIQLVDAQGRIMYNKREGVMMGTNIIGISSLSHLSAGIYFVNVMYEGETIRSRVIKMNE